MNSEQRKAIEAKIGRTLTAEEIGRGSINRREDRPLRAAIAAANQQPKQARWIETTMEYTPGKRETPDQYRKRMRQSREQRSADSQAADEQAKNLANDPVYRRMNEVAAQTVERMRWDPTFAQSAWDRALNMQRAATDNDREVFQSLNKSHVEYLESVTNQKQSVIDAEIARLQEQRKSGSADRYEEPLPSPDKSTYSHIKRASGMMQFVNRADGHIVEYDPRVPQAREFAEQKLAKHQADTVGKYGEPVQV